MLKKGVWTMATKSFLKDITIKNRKEAVQLVNALEHAHKKRSDVVDFKRSYSDASDEDVRKMFIK